MSNHTIQTLGSMMRRRRRRRTFPTSSQTARKVTVVLVGVSMAGAGAVLLLLSTMRRSSSNTPAAGRRPLLQGFPSDASAALWPDNRYHSELREHVLTSCLPHEKDSSSSSTTATDTAGAVCQERMANGTTQHILGVLRPPGVLGDIFESFVIQSIEHSNNMDMLVLTTSHLEDISYTSIVRPAVLPPMLEVFDLVLHTMDRHIDHNTNNDNDVIPAETIVDVARQWTRWHCRLAQISKDTALLTIPMDRMMVFPGDAQADLTSFLHLHQDNKKKGPHNNQLDIDMEDIAERTFDRIDQVNAMLAGWSTTTTESDSASFLLLQDAIEEAIRNEIRSGSCHLDPIVLSSSDEPTRISSRTTEIIGNFLNEDPAASNRICTKYPSARICTKSSS
jgi:hypothetical protein